MLQLNILWSYVSPCENHIPTAQIVMDKFSSLDKYVINNMGIGYPNQNQGENYYV